jgi:type II secretory pathway pseudopilin PulG
MNPIRHSKRGFTFVEVLLAASITALVGLTLYQALTNGIKLWQRSQRLMVEQEIALFFDKLAVDLRNTYPFSQMPFHGYNEKLSFPTLVVHAGQNVPSLGRVEYGYDLNKRSLVRRFAPYGLAQTEEYSSSQTLATQLTHLKFRYVYLTEHDEVISNEILDRIPATIEVEVGFMDHNVKKVIKKFIDIPIGL